MYLPKHFEEQRIEVLHALIEAYPLATLITHNDYGLNANHIPLQLKTTPGPGLLQGHIARANPVLADLDKPVERLAVFQGPQMYISPSWYATKQQTGKVVPTWNYCAVHVYGQIRLIDDRNWLHEHLTEFTRDKESGLPEPWSLADAPTDFIDRIIQHIIGFEMTITRLQGKWKVSQNQPPENRKSIIEGLSHSGFAEAQTMAKIIENYQN